MKAAFELRLMCLSGYRPELDACAACGREEMDAGRLFADSGELYCSDCRAAGGYELSRSVIDAMRYIISAESRRIFAFRLPEAELAELGRVCEAYTLHALDRSFGSLDYYKKLRKQLQ